MATIITRASSNGPLSHAQVDANFTNLNNALSDPIDSSLVTHIASGTGAVATTVQAVLRETVSVKRFGAVGNGVADDTVAIQAALDAGFYSVYVPPGNYLCSGLVMPTTFGFILHGEVGASVLVHKAGGAKILTWPTSSIAYTQGHVRGITFKGTNGANHCIDTTGVGGLTLTDIYISDVPTGYSGIYVNGAAATYVHDIVINGLQVYSNTAGHSGIRFGPLVSDTSVSRFIMNGNLVVNYCLYFDINAVTTRITDSHPYNASINVMRMAGSNNDCAFNSVVFDNATNDIVSISSSTRINFTDCWFEAIKSGYSGLLLASATGVSSYNSRFAGASGAAAAVTADSGSTDVKIVGGNVGTLTNYVEVFNLDGARSYATAVAGVNPLGLSYSFSGATVSVQAQNTTQFLGVNGGQAVINNTYYLTPEAGTIESFRMEVGSTPAAGQTFTFNLQKNGSNIGTITIENGSFGGSLSVATPVAQFDTVAIESIFSATSGSTNVRYSVKFKA